MGGRQNVLILPSQKARKLADYLKVAIFMHFTLGVLLFPSGRFMDGVVDLIGATIGYLAIKDPIGYSIQQVLCYTLFCGMVLFWAAIRTTLYFTGVSTDDAPGPAWQFYAYVGTLIAGPIIYTLGIVVGYQLYKELKLIVEELQQGLGGGGG
eukprot:CAMPEP_0205833524 /NCGR_PEP_ID=MMETSP0206-20130828/49981_1 /ASSEMBLY_ACC=CAM_ASM_000279 /TAXON_ID=36767 /ORGANISM="Euplotes focardii, Strain TN1" /LENGTH=151 /DNA_ID=CAMNT_0053140015 /DNA_START=49 /DNA_END=500 /DNA_ORIENTATION=+